MARQSTIFTAPAGAAAAAVCAEVAERLGGEAGPPRQERRTMLDTFDWRLHRAGLALDLVVVDGRGTLTLREWGDASVVAAAPTGSTPPARPEDLPAGALRRRVAPLLDVRALLPVVSEPVIVRPIVVRDRQGKITVRASIDDLGDWVVARLVPVRGYERAARRAGRVLASVGLEPLDDEPASASLARLGRAPGDRGGKLNVELHAKGPAAAGWVGVLIALLDDVEYNVPGALAGTDIEFLHDLRVAVRTSRSAVRHAHGVLPDELLRCFSPELKLLQRSTGTARDLDVYLLEVEDDLASLSAESAAALEPFHRLLKARHRAARHQLRADLTSDACTAFLKDWRETLESLGVALAQHAEEAGEWGHWPIDAHRNLDAVAGERIRAQHRKLVKGGRAITDASPPTQLHDLRKQAKELRYLLELFGGVLPKERVKPLVKALKALQDVLGEFQDTEVQVVSLRGWADELATKHAIEAATLLAMGELVERLQNRQAASRKVFAERFADFVAAGRP